MTGLPRRLLAAVLVSAAVAMPSDALAQVTAGARGWASGSFGSQSAPAGFGTTQTFPVNAESGTASATYTTASGRTLSVGGGAFLLRRIGVGAAFSRTTSATAADLVATVPHPFFFNQPRRASASYDGLERTESVLHIQMRVVLPWSSRLEVAVFGGPSRFQVEQALVSEPRVTETYPYDEIALSSTGTRTSGSGIGMHAGGDIAYYPTAQVGVGFMAQFSSATAAVGTTDIKAGGLQVGAGIRLRF